MAAQVLLHIHCESCGHDQTTEAIRPIIFEETLMAFSAGSSADFCDSCGFAGVTLVSYSVNELAEAL